MPLSRESGGGEYQASSIRPPLDAAARAIGEIVGTGTEIGSDGETILDFSSFSCLTKYHRLASFSLYA